MKTNPKQNKGNRRGEKATETDAEPKSNPQSVGEAPTTQATGEQPAPQPATELSYITPALHALAVPIDSLKLDPQNARKHGDRNRTAIRTSLKKFGQQRPISVDADGIILAGNGTYEQAKELGWTHIAVAQSNLRGVEARAFAIADNRTGELATWDPDVLTAQLGEIAAANIDLSIEDLEFTDGELDALLKEVSGEAEGSDAIGRPSLKKGSRKSGADRDLHKIVITCRDEAHQSELLERFKTEQLEFRAL